MTRVRRVGARVLLAATAFAMLAAGCGGSSSDPTTAAPTTAAPAATSAAPAATTAAPADTTAPPAATTAAPADTTAAPAGDDDLFALGEDLFLISAGGVGCASCHGKEAKGDVGVGPNIQGKSVVDIKTQLEENELMEFLKKALSTEDIEAVAVYLKYLEENAG